VALVDVEVGYVVGYPGWAADVVGAEIVNKFSEGKVSLFGGHQSIIIDLNYWQLDVEAASPLEQGRTTPQVEDPLGREGQSIPSHSF
jgi:hypothetical protein